MDASERAANDPVSVAEVERYYAAESALLNLPSPHIEALVHKLLIICDEEIRSDDKGDHQKRLIIGDLNRFKILKGL